mmetsp:Transcript_9008/g.27003  ORF Transcript_9008/g.27003 Transcript_9008/m.27003 type:complete len:168 (-) Transcript_9008:1921-2424(-)
MGPSGSGKTSLLGILAGRYVNGRTTGSLFIDGSPVNFSDIKRHVGFVEQFDVFVENLTVHEMLLYTAELACSKYLPTTIKRSRVVILSSRLGLDDCSNSRISVAGRRCISGGQCKRVAIALALLGSAQVLVLDEPTAGLDACTATEVHLRNSERFPSSTNIIPKFVH